MKVSTFLALAGTLALAAAQDDTAGFNGTADLDSTSYAYKTNWNSLTDCVAQDAFSSCIQPLSSTNSTCSSACDMSSGDLEDCQAACACTMYTAEINCALEYCWNRVYGCDYQKTALNVMINCDTDSYGEDDSTSDYGEEDSELALYASLGLPYFPAPINASDLGECSCNLPYISILLSEELFGAYGQKCGEVNDPSDLNQACTCCAYSGAYTAFAEVCPTTDIFDLIIPSDFESLIQNNYSWSDCADTLSSTNCVKDLDFPSLPSNASFSQSSDLPTATGSVSDLGGQITSPLSGYTVTWTANSTAFTITATSTTVAEISSSAKGSASMTKGSSTGGKSATSKGASASASATSSGNGAMSTEIAAGAVVLGLAAVLVGI